MPLKTIGRLRTNWRRDSGAHEHDVEQAVVEPGVGGEVHASTVGPGVGRGHGPARERAPLAVDGHVERRGPPRAPARAARRRRRPTGPDATAPRWRSGWRPSRSPARRCRGTCGRRRSPTSTGARLAVGEHRAGRDRVERDPRLAGEVVAAPAGQDADDGVLAAAQRAGDRADQAVARQRDDDLAGVGGRDARARGRATASASWRRGRSARGARARPRRRAAPSARGRRRLGVDEQGDGARHAAGILPHQRASRGRRASAATATGAGSAARACSAVASRR